MLEDEVPVLTVTFSTQEVLLFRNAKTREIVVGAEDKVEQCMYGAVVTRVEEELDNPTTGGWKVIEVRFPFIFRVLFCLLIGFVRRFQMVRRSARSYI